ncbi:hypothetical protein P3X46_019200 [Hevea brasiliensis]|uniref:Uncharacterized protein n=2 Tax=Hevea brasiliensis TaxID=3981 RepID=A0A6A6LT51_HEVBR|nr:uncharacterized protein LOC110658610 [Hevea brasiliensis]KAF2302789.1 hypothetical protein GH714_008409 [Hevea brasiliensis]KAF2302790.1 hypothetical protein GH714_008428 [Hevea brasiliensis]KAJ9167578.1 hypothetical protein P3X46_019200 [Hevea brasiliensis]
MAPRKRKAEGQDEGVKPITATSTRVTRSSTRLANSNSYAPPVDLPTKKKGKTVGKKKVKTEDEKETETNNVEEKESEKVEAKEETTDDRTKKTIVIEHCKQCNSFMKRATLVKNGLENSVPSIRVVLNPDKPRRGCFEIREEGGEKFISLLDMKRPFKPMKDLDMDKVIADIIDKIK